jgi:hypothetical protein
MTGSNKGIEEEDEKMEEFWFSEFDGEFWDEGDEFSGFV